MLKHLSKYPYGSQIQRLTHIGDTHKPLRQQCYEKAVSICRQHTRQVDTYEHLLKRLDKMKQGASPAMDTEWMEATRSESQRAVDELKTQKAAPKFDALIQLYLSQGRYQEARKACAARRDSNNDWEHALNLRVMEARIQFLAGEKVSTIHKVLDSREELKPTDLNLALLLAALHELQATTTVTSSSGTSSVSISPSSFTKAAEYFLDMDFDYLSNYPDVAQASDVGKYIAICALVSFPRAQLSELVHQNYGFSELVGPQSDIMEMLECFLNSEFQRFFTLWLLTGANSLYDLILSDIQKPTDELMKERALIQAIYPYTSFRLDELAFSFNMSDGALETLLRQTIVAHNLKLKIDKIDGTVKAYQSDAYSQLEQNKKLAETYCRSAKVAMLMLES